MIFSSHQLIDEKCYIPEYGSYRSEILNILKSIYATRVLTTS